MEKILLIGAGALARDFIDIGSADKFVAAYVDPEFAKTDTVDGLRILTNWQEAVKLATHYALAVSSMVHRERARVIAADAGLKPASPLISPLARIARTASLQQGCVVGHFVAIGPSARLGLDCMVMHGVVVGHDSCVADNVVLCAGVSLGGYVKLGARSFVGTNAVLAPNINIGSDSYIAAGAACLRDAPSFSQLIGNPAKRMPLS